MAIFGVLSRNERKELYEKYPATVAGEIEQALSFSASEDASRHHAAVLGVLGKIWNLPNTIIGLIYGGIGHVVSEIGNVLGFWTAEARVRPGNNAIEFTGNIFGELGALTLGNTITWGAERNDFWYKEASGHERFHTIQGQFLGPIYIPLHALNMSASLLTAPFPSFLRTSQGASRFFHRQVNFMEGPFMRDELYGMPK
jgi:hypothetical protein